MDLVHQEQIKIKHWVTKRDGNQVYLAKSEYHRATTQMLDEGSDEYPTFKLPEYIMFNDVLWGFPQINNTHEAELNLSDMSFDVVAISRIPRKIERARIDIPLKFVQISKKRAQNKKIFNLTKLGHRRIKVESQKTRITIPQSHTCQTFCHNQGSCHRSPRCMKCGPSHITNLCQKPCNEVATCVNCGGSPPTSLKRCGLIPQFHSLDRRKWVIHKTAKCTLSNEDAPKHIICLTPWNSFPFSKT